MFVNTSSRVVPLNSISSDVDQRNKQRLSRHNSHNTDHVIDVADDIQLLRAAKEPPPESSTYYDTVNEWRQSRFYSAAKPPLSPASEDRKLARLQKLGKLEERDKFGTKYFYRQERDPVR